MSFKIVIFIGHVGMLLPEKKTKGGKQRKTKKKRLMDGDKTEKEKSISPATFRKCFLVTEKYFLKGSGDFLFFFSILWSEKVEN